VPKAELIRERLIFQCKGLQAKLNSLAGFDVEVNASSSLAKAFDKHGFPYKRTKPSKSYPAGKPSFTKQFLTSCKNPIADTVNEIRNLKKLQGTFIESYILESNVNGKIHCQFHPLRGDSEGARSGRYSSDHPDLQNIPSRDPVYGPMLRGLFIPDDGHVAWRKYDYSQIEYRCLIHFAVGPGSDEARRLFNANPNMDYHDWAMDLIVPHTTWDISTPEKRKQMRKPIKNINFGLVFGMGEDHLAESIGMSLPNGKASKEAKAVFAAYHKGVPFAKTTMDACSEEIQRLGYITTILGRRSRFDLWEPIRYNPAAIPLPYDKAILYYGQIKRAYAYRGLNRRLQGSAADILKAATLRCWLDGVFDRTGVPRLTIHDELDFSDPGGCDDAFREMKHIMENTVKLLIPIRADGDIGPDWGHGKAI